MCFKSVTLWILELYRLLKFRLLCLDSGSKLAGVVVHLEQHQSSAVNAQPLHKVSYSPSMQACKACCKYYL